MTKSRGLVTLVAACVGTAVLIWMARQAADIAATSDTAVIESYTLSASQGRLALGPYSRFQWHHPGPLYFFLMAPSYVLSGGRTAGLSAAVLALNGAALGFIVHRLTKRATGASALVVTSLLSFYLWRSAELLVSPWNPHVPVLALVALAVGAADVMAGHVWTLPLVAGLASLTGQTHVGLLPSSLALGGLAAAGAAAQRRRSPDSAVRWMPIVVSGVVLLVCWTPVFVQQLTGRPGNLTAIWTFFVVESHPGQRLTDAISAWSDMLSGFIRPDFYVAHGWKWEESRVRWAETFAGVQVAGLLACAAFPRTSGRFERLLASVLLVVSALALWSVTRIEGAIFDHEIFWISGLGVLNTAVVAGAVAHRWTSRRGVLMSNRVASAACWVVAASVVVVGVRELRGLVVRSASPAEESVATKELAGDLARYLAAEGLRRPLIRIDQDAWGVTAGVVLQLQKRGVPVAIEDDWMAMFTPDFSATGREPAVFTVAGPAQHVRILGTPGDVAIASRGPFHLHRDMAAVTQ